MKTKHQLTTEDVTLIAGIIEEADIADLIAELTTTGRSAEQTGVIAFVKIFGRLSKKGVAEKAYAFLANKSKYTADEIKQLPVDETIEIIKGLLPEVVKDSVKETMKDFLSGAGPQ